MAAEVDLDKLLQRLTDLTRELVGARYCALSVTDVHGVIESFITSGLTRDERAAIGPLPVGEVCLARWPEPNTRLSCRTCRQILARSGFHPTIRR